MHRSGRFGMAYGNERILESGGVDPDANYAVQKEDRYIVNQRLLSLYDIHSDGSGVFYSSRLRPIVNMRPRVVMKTVPEIAGLRGAFEAIIAHRVVVQRSALRAMRLALRLKPAQTLQPVLGRRIPGLGAIKHRNVRHSGESNVPLGISSGSPRRDNRRISKPGPRH